MNKRNSTLYIVLGVMCFSVIMLSIAYATLSKELTITYNTFTKSALTWNVAFDTAATSTLASSTGDAGFSCGATSITPTASVVTIPAVSLSKPGDRCAWKVTIKNTGGIDATLKTITWTKPVSACTTSGAVMTCGKVKYILGASADADSGTLTADANGSTGTTIAKSTGTKDVYVIVKYDGNDLLTTAASYGAAKVQLVFTQK